VDAPTGAINQVVLSGQNTTLIVGAGEAKIQSIGQGATVEALQVLGDGTKIISTGAFGAADNTGNGPVVDIAATTTGDEIGTTTTIAIASGGLGGAFGSYAVGGTGDDILYGSTASDFFRGGTGNDTIFTYAGNDLVRGGAGSDEMTLGLGVDTIYYTADQLQNGDIDTVTDFGVGGPDVLAIQGDRVVAGGLSGIGGNELQITDIDGSVTTVRAQTGYQWKEADIFFVV
jgi:Ca2+-binding RTX toxin-like protein